MKTIPAELYGIRVEDTGKGAKGIAQDTFNATWNTKEESGWTI